MMELSQNNCNTYILKIEIFLLLFIRNRNLCLVMILCVYSNLIQEELTHFIRILHVYQNVQKLSLKWILSRAETFAATIIKLNVIIILFSVDVGFVC